MKSTGICRPVDELGRIVIPKEIRNSLNIKEKDPLEIYIDGESIVLKKHEPGCILCSKTDSIVSIHGKNICKECIKKLNILIK